MLRGCAEGPSANASGDLAVLSSLYRYPAIWLPVDRFILHSNFGQAWKDELESRLRLILRRNRCGLWSHISL